VRIDIYNVLGQKVKTLIDRREAAGKRSVTWNGKNAKGEDVSSGIYFYRMKAGQFVQSRKMLLLK
jgi:flagellar hook assembly protein FlgD